MIGCSTAWPISRAPPRRTSSVLHATISSVGRGDDEERAPDDERSLVGDGSETSPWELARQRLAEPEDSRTSWLATTRPDGRPHLMPVIAFWIDGAMHIVAGEGTRKGRNLSADGRCVVATSSTTLPSLDIVIEGRAEALTEDDAVRHMAEVLNEKGWPLEAKGDKVFGPNAPTAGPPPYTISGSSRRRCSVSPACSAWSSSIRRSCRDRPAGTSRALKSVRRADGRLKVRAPRSWRPSLSRLRATPRATMNSARTAQPTRFMGR